MWENICSNSSAGDFMNDSGWVQFSRQWYFLLRTKDRKNTEKLVIYITLKIFYNANRIAEAVSRVAIRRYISSKQGDNRYEEENNYNLAGNNYVYRMPYWK